MLVTGRYPSVGPSYVRFEPSEYEIADQVEAYGGRMKDIISWFTGYVAGMRDLVDPYLGQVDVPVHIIWGADDVIVLEAMGRELERRLPQSTFTALDSAGHAPWADQPESYAKVVRSWINGSFSQVKQRKQV